MKKTFLAFITAFVMAWFVGCAHNTGTLNLTMSPTPVVSRILQRGELVVGMVGNMPPLNMTDKDGRIFGLEPDLAAFMAKAMGVELKIEVMDFPDLLPALEQGRVDMIVSGFAMTPRRNLKVAFVGPYYISGKSLLTKTETLAEIEDGHVLNNPNIRLSALKNSTSQEFVEKNLPKARLKTAKDYDQAIKMVLEDKVDAMIADFPVCAVSLFRYPQENLMALLKPMSYEPIGIAVPASDHLMVNWVENYLQRAEAVGLLEKLEAKWFDDDSWLEKLP